LPPGGPGKGAARSRPPHTAHSTRGSGFKNVQAAQDHFEGSASADALSAAWRASSPSFADSGAPAAACEAAAPRPAVACCGAAKESNSPDPENLKSGAAGFEAGGFVDKGEKVNNTEPFSGASTGAG